MKNITIEPKEYISSEPMTITDIDSYFNGLTKEFPEEGEFFSLDCYIMGPFLHKIWTTCNRDKIIKSIFTITDHDFEDGIDFPNFVDGIFDKIICPATNGGKNFALTHIDHTFGEYPDCPILQMNLYFFQQDNDTKDYLDLVYLNHLFNRVKQLRNEHKPEYPDCDFD